MPLAENRPDIPDEQARWMRGEEDPLRVFRDDGTGYGHPLQYAVTGHPHSVTVVGTGNATDEQIRKMIEQTYGMPLPAMPIERFNRCPTCEEWSPCSVRKAWRGKLPGIDDGDVEDALRAAGKLTEPQRRDPLEDARDAWIEANHAGHSSPEDGERYLRGAQTGALLSIAENLAAIGPAVASVASAVMPGVVGGTTAAATALLEALRAQTEAIRAIGARLEAVAFPLRPVMGSFHDFETNDLEMLVDQQRARWLTVPEPAPVRLLPTAEAMRAKLERIRELVEQRQALSHGGQFDSDAVVQPSELLAILDGDPEVPGD
jgi:hypothetical protein